MIERAPPEDTNNIVTLSLPAAPPAVMEYQGVRDARELSDIVAKCRADFIAADNPIRRRETALALDNARAELNVKALENRRSLIKQVTGPNHEHPAV